MRPIVNGILARKIVISRVPSCPQLFSKQSFVFVCPMSNVNVEFGCKVCICSCPVIVPPQGYDTFVQKVKYETECQFPTSNLRNIVQFCSRNLYNLLEVTEELWPFLLFELYWMIGCSVSSGRRQLKVPLCFMTSDSKNAWSLFLLEWRIRRIVTAEYLLQCKTCNHLQNCHW